MSGIDLTPQEIEGIKKDRATRLAKVVAHHLSFAALAETEIADSTTDLQFHVGEYRSALAELTTLDPTHSMVRAMKEVK